MITKQEILKRHQECLNGYKELMSTFATSATATATISTFFALLTPLEQLKAMRLAIGIIEESKIMKTYKSISYAYASSKTATSLGHGKNGCYYIELLHIGVESCFFEPASGCEGFLSFKSSDLQNLFDEFDYPIYPASKKYHPEYYSNDLKNRGVTP